MPLPEKILCLDTTGSELMLALAEGDTLVFRHRERSESQRYHSAMLIPLIQLAMAETGWVMADLDALAVNVGPGSFTGIRTGITSIRLMGQFLDLPVFVFNPFELLAAQYPGESVAVYLDALRGRAYHAVLKLTPEGLTVLEPPAMISLEAHQPPLADRVLASPALLEAVPNATSLAETDCFTPEPMLTLLRRFPDTFRQSWQAVLPLYLQEPNITQRKARPGMMR